MKAVIIIFFFACLATGTRAQSVDFYGKEVAKDICAQYGMKDDKDAKESLDKICDAADIPNNFVLAPCTNIDNCFALNKNGILYIVYDIQFFNKVKTFGFTEKNLPKNKVDWAALTILAHELGHHMCQHTTNKLLSEALTPVQMELQADEYAGTIMYKLGATLAQAQQAMYSNDVPEQASLTHPGLKNRLEAIANGWNKEMLRYGANHSPADGPAPVPNKAGNIVAEQPAAGTQTGSMPEMVKVDGGTFMMGNSKDGPQDWDGAHKVTVSSFYMGKYEVTFDEFDAYCTAARRKKPDDGGWGRGNKPVINVTWDEAVAYCKWLSQQTGKNFRLPTEAEWEFAARGGIKTQGYKYSGSDVSDDVGWCRDNSRGPQAVGKKLPNELGIYDMTGNAAEWCGDWFGFHYYGESPAANPQGPEILSPGISDEKVTRGGGIGGAFVTLFWRGRCTYGSRKNDLGFRVAYSD